jgi:hypothetical protein
MTDIFERAAALGAQSWNPETRTLEAVFSTGAPVSRHDQRGPYIERLDLNQDWRSFIGAPVADSHRRSSVDDVLGSVIAARTIGAEGLATLKMSKRPRAEAVVQDILDGHLRAVSVGYVVDEWADSTEDGKRVRTATRWTPKELSICPLGSDAGAVIRTPPIMENESHIETAQTDPPDPIQDRAAANVEIRSIAKLAALPQTWIDEAIDRAWTIDQAREGAFAAMKVRSGPATAIRTATASISGFDANDPDFRVRAIGDAITARITGEAPSEQARQFVGLTAVEVCRELLRIRGQSTFGSAGVIAERAMTTSDFPALMGDAANRSMRMAYDSVPSALKQVARQITAPDFRTIHKIQLSAVPTLLPVNEAGEFHTGVLTDQQETFKLASYGRIVSLTRQIIVNDDLGGFADVSRRMGVAAAAFEATQLVSLVESPPVMSDGVAVFNATHGNVAMSGVLSETTLTAARLLLRQQTDPSGMLIAATPKYLLVPPALETLAEKTITAVQATQTSNVNTFTFLTLLVEPRLTDAKAFYIFADPTLIDGLMTAFLQGQEGPIMNSEIGFQTDGIAYRVRMDWGGAWVEPRGVVKNAGG